MNVDEFTHNWKKHFKKNRLLWITTLNHRLVEFAEGLTITNAYPQNFLETNKGILATYFVGSSLVLCMKTEKGIEHLHSVLKVPISEVNVIIKALLKCGFKEILKMETKE